MSIPSNHKIATKSNVTPPPSDGPGLLGILIAFIVIFLVVGGLMAITYNSSGEEDEDKPSQKSAAMVNLQETVEGFELWSVENPEKMKQVMEQGIDFKKLSKMITGEEAHLALRMSSVEYHPKDKGNYDLCIDVKNLLRSTPYRYSSESDILEEDETCRM